MTGFAWVVGAASVVALAGVGVAACSSSSGSPSSPQDSGTMMQDSAVTTDSGSGGGDTSTAGDTGTGGDAGSDAPCETPPSLFPETTPGVYCPFSADDAGSPITCNPGQHCCEVPVGSSTPSTCEAMGTACPVTGSVDWQCEAPIDCTSLDAGTPVCCGTGTATTATHCGVTWPEWNSFTGTKCMASCPAPGITVCEGPSDCTTDAGSTCTASKSNGNDFGYCAP